MSTRARWLLPAVLGCAWLASSSRTSAEESALLGRPNPLTQLFPSAAARADRERATLQAQLERALLRLPGVTEAHATVALAAPDSVALHQPLPPARASVLLRARGQVCDEHLARTLAHSLLPAGSELRLTLLRDTAPAPQARQAFRAGQTRRVGPFQVAPSSAGWLRGTLAALLVSNALLAALLLWSRVRSR